MRPPPAPATVRSAGRTGRLDPAEPRRVRGAPLHRGPGTPPHAPQPAPATVAFAAARTAPARPTRRTTGLDGVVLRNPATRPADWRTTSPMAGCWPAPGRGRPEIRRYDQC